MTRAGWSREGGWNIIIISLSLVYNIIHTYTSIRRRNNSGCFCYCCCCRTALSVVPAASADICRPDTAHIVYYNIILNAYNIRAVLHIARSVTTWSINHERFYSRANATIPSSVVVCINIDTARACVFERFAYIIHTHNNHNNNDIITCAARWTHASRPQIETSAPACVRVWPTRVERRRFTRQGCEKSRRVFFATPPPVRSPLHPLLRETAVAAAEDNARRIPTHQNILQEWVWG